MLSLHDVSAWVEVDGKELKQYDIKVDFDRSQVTCWIATQAGKNFSVVFKDNAVHRNHALCSFLRLDGSLILGKILRPQAGFGIFPPSAVQRTVAQRDQSLTATSSRPFMFSKLELTDEDEYLNQASVHLGEISILIYRTQTIGLVPFSPGLIATGHGKIHERSKKAVSHCVSYGDEVQKATQHSYRVKHLDGNVPLATFVFKYRDSSLLQANGIIPKPPPTEKKATIHEEVFDLTTDACVKPDPFDNDIIEIEDDGGQKRMGLSLKRTKRILEREGRPNKRIKREKDLFPSGEIIDLT